MIVLVPAKGTFGTEHISTHVSVGTQEWETKMDRLQGGKAGCLFSFISHLVRNYIMSSVSPGGTGKHNVFLLHCNLFCVSVYVWV